MGIYEANEAYRACLEWKAQDYVVHFEKSFNGFETVENAYAFRDLCCKDCDVEQVHSYLERYAGQPKCL